MKVLFILYSVLLLNILNTCAQSNHAFDLALYEEVLDPELCERQLMHLRNNAPFLRTRFRDASCRFPRGITKGNTMDLGNYFNCLEINEEDQNLRIEGKYCVVNFPLDQENFELPTIPVFPNITWPEDLNITWPGITWPEPFLELPWDEFHSKTSSYTEEVKMKLRIYRRVVRDLLGDSHLNDHLSRSAGIDLTSLDLELAVCIPKACTAIQAVDFFTNNLTATMTYTEQFCRLPNDKTWVAADTVAVVLLSIIGLITIFSTAYDIRHTVILEKDSKEANKLYQSFSLFTNTRNFFVFPSSPNVVTCLDGIRSIAMMWVIVGHTFQLKVSLIPENPLDMIQWMLQLTSLWITSATITVDTFFVISGLLIVYTTAAKISKSALIKNLHLFYLNRIARMFPVLAFSILLMASFLHRTADGPYFEMVAEWVNNCRTNWWYSLLYIQNFIHPDNACLPHTWYIAIDMQLYIISPIVLFWVLGKNKKTSWIALVGALAAILIASSIYNFINNFKSGSIAFSRPPEQRYTQDYYLHTLTRASPFFVGMIYGYLLHLYRGKPVKIPLALASFFWVIAFSGTTLVFILPYWNMPVDWDNQLLDNIINSYQRPLWGACVGWIIFACHKGYGGPINWVLSVYVFKILGRLSYAMYILHYPLIYLVDSTALAPFHFTVNLVIQAFLVDFSLTVISAFLVTIAIDMPFANLIKMALEGKQLKPLSLAKPRSGNENDVEPEVADPEIDLESKSLSNGLVKKTENNN